MGARIVILLLSIIGIVMCCCGPAAELVPVYVEKTPSKLLLVIPLADHRGAVWNSMENNVCVLMIINPHAILRSLSNV